MTDVPIYNSSDLRNEIFRLQGLEQEQSTALKQRFSSPGAIFSSVFSLFPKSAPHENGTSSAGILDQDFFGIISRFALPFTLNKTLFRNSNFLIKALVGLVSQKASHYISEDSVVSVWDKAKGLFTKLIHKDHDDKPEVTSFRKIKKAS
jgi:hypothetical protein